MAGLPWFELDTDYHDSPKAEALKSRLRNPEADAFPSRLYAYCYKHALDRFDPEVAQHVVEAAAKWRGRRGVLFDALFAVGVLERDGGKVVVHGVAERLAPHLAKREADRIRIAEKRDKAADALRQRADVAQESQRRRGDVAGNRDKDSNKDQKQQKLAAVAVAPPPTDATVTPDEKRSPLRRTLSDALVAVYAVERGGGYGFDAARDGQALTRLLGWSPDVTEHARRFRLALQAPGGDYAYRVDTLAQFATGRIWNHFAPATSPPKAAAGKRGMSEVGTNWNERL
jgi:hypothetical protein